MNKIEVSSDLQKHYNDYYHNKSDMVWRKLGAIDKTKNIIEICNNISINNLLEIGAEKGLY